MAPRSSSHEMQMAADPPGEAARRDRQKVTRARWLQVKTVAVAAVLLAAVVLPGLLQRPQSLGSAQYEAQRDGLTIVLRAARHLHDPEAIPDLVQRFKAAGVAHVLVQMKQDESDEVTGGLAFFPTPDFAIAPGYEDGRLLRLMDALVDAGIRISAWVPAFNDESAWQTHPEWRAWSVNDEGEIEQQVNWLCPRHPEAVAYEAKFIAQAAASHPSIGGVYTDFIRYDSDRSCACARCLKALDAARGDGSSHGAEVQPRDVLEAAREQNALWRTWTRIRSRAVCDAVDAMRDAIDELRGHDTWFGACVLPFSAKDYSFNTQSGQDYRAMARAGLDEIVVMGYWDDWQKSPKWLQESLASAAGHVEGECELSCLIDGDMSIRRTWLTLDAIRDVTLHRLGYFNYWVWKDDDLARVRASADAARVAAPPRPASVAVAIRVDTEPDYQRSYDSVHPSMITELADLFESEGMRATFVTCGRIAEMQRDAIVEVARRGHEIACHAYDHEQLDDLDPELERAAIENGIAALRSTGAEVVGFGAPRNSITAAGRDLLIERGLAYDGSAAYDPTEWLLDVDYAWHSEGRPGRIMVIPFIMPNDWDALHVMGVSVESMGRMWRERLEAVVESGEPVFVLDIHQWRAVGEPERAVLREFIRHARSRGDCRLVTLREAALQAEDHVASVEAAARRIAAHEAEGGGTSTAKGEDP